MPILCAPGEKKWPRPGSTDRASLLAAETSSSKFGSTRIREGVRLRIYAGRSPRPAVTIRELLKATLRHRPDRIILGEIR
ncbi:MAG: ATPase, T2SS/T4P/T4SS family, partial [Pirellulales bacterium]